MVVDDLLGYIDTIAPFKFAEKWDNVGLQVGDPQAKIRRVLLSLDPTDSSIQEAINKKCDCLVTHHPLFIEGLRSVRADEYPQSLIFKLVSAGVNLIVAHTNLDASRHGANAYIAETLRLSNVKPLGSIVWAEESFLGVALVGDLEEKTSIGDLGSRLAKVIPADNFCCCGSLGKQVKRIAVCSGSGGSFLKEAFSYGAECFITGEIRYHDARWAEEIGMIVLAFGHFASEAFVMERLALSMKQWSEARREDLEILVFREEKDAIKTFDLKEGRL